MTYKTEQEEFWAGEFGVDYIDRNNNDDLLAANLNLFSEILNKSEKIDSVTELGANIGLNLKALKLLFPNQEQHAVEINESAIEKLANMIPNNNIFKGSILDFKPKIKTDLVFTKTVLIHINPEMLNKVYDVLYTSSNKYILICEYYNSTPVEVEYRGYKEKLYKRDFAGEFMDKFPDVSLVNYGFSYARDQNFIMSDVMWFLMRKTNI